jgi:hypothetical protein
MTLDATIVRRYLKDFDFDALFRDVLGWDNLDSSVSVSADGETFTLNSIAEKRGMVAFACSPMSEGPIPDYAMRRKIERQIAKSVLQHIVIYVDESKTTQIWQWVKREMGKPAACREHTYSRNQPGDALIQKLEAIAFSLEEEETLSHPEVVNRARTAFDVEKVTKRFYDRFKAEHDSFLQFIDGIPEDGMQRWYVSVMLNRLMFVYFIQKKGFLDNDTDYLRNKLALSKQKGRDHFYSDFLCPLFFEGFSKQESQRSTVNRQILGKVPYLNGGLFTRHQIEELHGKHIRIPDAAFERVFDFFDQYHWHLDERPLRADNEINPDVLGYIFEKYINQKQMGAYYSKEDITEFITKNTVIPFLLDATMKNCRIAFDCDQSIWRLLQIDPDRYIYDAVKKGVKLPLPPEIAEGLADVSKRTEWNKPAPTDYGLPTEIWREVIARSKHYEEIYAKLAEGKLKDVNDLITFNLDIRQFSQDIIENSEGPELIHAFYHAIERVTVLDPACGSGAFLFAALNVLEPLYEACLDRMESFIADQELLNTASSPEKFVEFRTILERVAKRPNRRYFILKSIILNNLFGVDIMEEAVEICKLRLFLKLVAQVEHVEQVEPLPDIDFNIRVGNNLVGFATQRDVEKSISVSTDGSRRLFWSEEDQNAIRSIKDNAERVSGIFHRFCQCQINENIHDNESENIKIELKHGLKILENQLNHYLAREYGVDTNKDLNYNNWLLSHKPFHWFIEFFDSINRGGFDVIISNPPYVEYSKVKGEYTLLDNFSKYTTNLYSAFCYRATEIKNKNGYISFIVPVSLPSTDRMQPLRVLLTKDHNIHHVSFSTRPAKLFDGAEQRLTIYVQSPSNRPKVFSGGYLKWFTAERPSLFSCIEYIEVPPLNKRNSIWPKVKGQIHQLIFNKMLSKKSLIESQMLGSGSRLYYKNTGIRYFNTVTLRPPKCWINGAPSSSSRETILNVESNYLSAVHAFLLSTTFFIYYQSTSNCRDLNPSDIFLSPVPNLSEDLARLKELSIAVEEDYIAKGKIIRMKNKLTGQVELESLTPANSKHIIDEIDGVLARNYGFTEEELDFVINYDIKYRIGLGSEEF